MADEKPNGLFVTDNAGNVYYLRPEILAQAKMPPEDLEKLKAEMAASGKGTEGGELSVQDLETVAGGMNVSFSRMSFNLPHMNVLLHQTPKLDLGKVMTSTVMCPW
jgi:hypothetical protein